MTRNIFLPDDTCAVSVGNPLGQRVGDGLGLLMNLLEHVVAILPFIHGVRAELAFLHRPVRIVSFAVDNLYRCACDFGDIAVFEKHETTCFRQERGHIRSHIVFTAPQTEHDRRAAAGGNQAVGKPAADDLFEVACRRARIAGEGFTLSTAAFRRPPDPQLSLWGRG